MTPYTPQQNGVVERMNRTLMEKHKKYAQWCRIRAGILGKG
jgi:hypothetical protein